MNQEDKNQKEIISSPFHRITAISKSGTQAPYRSPAGGHRAGLLSAPDNANPCHCANRNETIRPRAVRRNQTQKKNEAGGAEVPRTCGGGEEGGKPAPVPRGGDVRCAAEASTGEDRLPRPPPPSGLPAARLRRGQREEVGRGEGELHRFREFRCAGRGRQRRRPPDFSAAGVVCGFGARGL
jgi:hypothetical protein